MMQRQTVRVSVEVRSGAARFRVGVQAHSLREALSVVGGKYPHGVVRVVFPAEPAGIFVGGPARMVGSGRASPKAA
jgi:hypothetical protein